MYPYKEGAIWRSGEKKTARILLRGRVALAPLVHVYTAPFQLLWRPMQHQAMVARVEAGVAIVGARVSLPREAARREAGGRRQLGGTSPPHGLATIELLGTGPPLDPLHGPFVVPRVAVEWARRRGARTRRRRRRRPGGLGWWGGGGRGGGGRHVGLEGGDGFWHGRGRECCGLWH